MSNVEGLDFLGFKCKVMKDNGTLAKMLLIKNPYEYVCFIDESVPFERNVSKQGATNCVKESIELFKKGLFAFWLPKNKMNDLDLVKTVAHNTGYTSSDKIIPMCYEDYNNMPVNHAEKPYNLLRLLDKKLVTKGMSELIILTAEDIIECNIILDRYNASTPKEVPSIEGVEILKQLWQDSLIKLTNLNGQPIAYNHFPPANDLKDIKVGMTTRGWAWLGEPKNNPTNKVFIAMAFSAWENDQNTMMAIQKAIKDACKDQEFNLDYEANIVDQKHLENISNKIIAQIKESKFIIADFTYNNRGVYFEAGLASGLGKPVVHLVRYDCLKGEENEGKKLHFDTQQINHLVWKTPEDIRRELPAWIKANIN